MHKQARNFLNKTKNQFPQNFKNKKVLSIGSFKVNGSEKDFFESCDYTGLDLGPGPGVDVVCPANKYDAPDGAFDVIVSCECWEHNPYYKESIINAIRMLKSGGFFVWSCASTGRPVHGTTTQDSIDIKAGVTAQGNTVSDWISMPNVTRQDWDNEYYRNINTFDIASVVDMEKNFSRYMFEYDNEHCDLYFLGIKR